MRKNNQRRKTQFERYSKVMKKVLNERVKNRRLKN